MVSPRVPSISISAAAAAETRKKIRKITTPVAKQERVGNRGICITYYTINMDGLIDLCLDNQSNSPANISVDQPDGLSLPANRKCINA
jgi:hypothetical protein